MPFSNELQETSKMQSLVTTSKFCFHNYSKYEFEINFPSVGCFHKGILLTPAGTFTRRWQCALGQGSSNFGHACKWPGDLVKNHILIPGLGWGPECYIPNKLPMMPVLLVRGPVMSSNFNCGFQTTDIGISGEASINYEPHPAETDLTGRMQSGHWIFKAPRWFHYAEKFQATLVDRSETLPDPHPGRSPHASEQQSPCAVTTEPVLWAWERTHGVHVLQLLEVSHPVSPCPETRDVTTMRSPHITARTGEDPACQT